MPKTAEKYTVVRDTREKDGHGWVFAESDVCAGTVTGTLRTGDYSLLGHENRFAVERKGSVVEFVQNITQKEKWACFRAELERLESLEAPFLLLEFTLDDVLRYPQGCGLPWGVRRRLRVSPQFYLKRLLEIQLEYRTRIILAGAHGRDVACSLFKRVAQRWPLAAA